MAAQISPTKDVLVDASATKPMPNAATTTASSLLVKTKKAVDALNPKILAPSRSVASVNASLVQKKPKAVVAKGKGDDTQVLVPKKVVLDDRTTDNTTTPDSTHPFHFSTAALETITGEKVVTSEALDAADLSACSQIMDASPPWEGVSEKEEDWFPEIRALWKRFSKREVDLPTPNGGKKRTHVIASNHRGNGIFRCRKASTPADRINAAVKTGSHPAFVSTTKVKASSESKVHFKTKTEIAELLDWVKETTTKLESSKPEPVSSVIAERMNRVVQDHAERLRKTDDFISQLKHLPKTATAEIVRTAPETSQPSSLPAPNLAVAELAEATCKPTASAAPLESALKPQVPAAAAAATRIPRVPRSSRVAPPSSKPMVSAAPAKSTVQVHVAPAATAAATTARKSLVPAPTTAARKSLAPAPTTTCKSVLPPPTAARKSSVPAPAAARKSLVPAPAAARKSLAPAPTTTCKSVLPPPTAARKSSVPAPAAARKSLAPASTTTYNSVLPPPTAARKSLVPAPAAARKSLAPAPTTTHKSVLPPPTAARRSTVTAMTSRPSQVRAAGAGAATTNRAPVATGRAQTAGKPTSQMRAPTTIKAPAVPSRSAIPKSNSQWKVVYVPIGDPRLLLPDPDDSDATIYAQEGIDYFTCF